MKKKKVKITTRERRLKLNSSEKHISCEQICNSYDVDVRSFLFSVVLLFYSQVSAFLSRQLDYVYSIIDILTTMQRNRPQRTTKKKCRDEKDVKEKCAKRDETKGNCEEMPTAETRNKQSAVWREHSIQNDGKSHQF